MSAQPIRDYEYYRDPVTEKWLDTWPLTTCELQEVRLSRVDVKASRDYQNRMSSHVDEDHAGRLTEVLRDPAATVPPLVVRRMATGRLVIGDGNHRFIGAQRAGRESLLAYVVTCDDKTFHYMAVAANARNALSLTPAERAVLIGKMAGQGMPQRTIAAQWGIPQRTVSHIVRAQQGSDLLREVGVAQPELLNTGAQSEASRLTVEDLDRMGTEILKDITASEMAAAAREILAAKPSERLAVAEDVGRRIAKDRRDRITPKSRRRRATAGWTPGKLASQLDRLTAAVSERPELCDDSKVSEALDAMLAAWK